MIDKEEQDGCKNCSHLMKKLRSRSSSFLSFRTNSKNLDDDDDMDKLPDKTLNGIITIKSNEETEFVVQLLQKNFKKIKPQIANVGGDKGF
jgi:hypothetical protein